jgi:acyl-CoA synthetase (AMP-forming)/AMP-acid ligase II
MEASMNPALWLCRSAIRSPGAPALFSGTRCLADYAEFARHALSIGGWLAARGVGPGATAAIWMPNRPEFLPILFGIWASGATAVPINAKLHPKEVGWILENATCRIVFTDRTGGLDGAGIALPMAVALDSSVYQGILAHLPLPAPVPRPADDVAWMFYTSGTTGRPKGAMLTCGNLMATSLSYPIDVDPVTAADAALYAAPMSHGAGLYALVHVLQGARHVVPESGRFDPTEIFALARALGNVSMFAAPTMVKRLVETARRTGETGEGIRTIVYGGGPMYVADIREALEVLGPRFVQIYGQGESPMCITALSRADIADSAHPDWLVRLASVGKAQSVAEVRVVAEDGSDLPPGETGEIVVAGPQVMAGYLNNPEANAKSLRDGWLWTGDVGWLDAAGYLTLVDRSKDLIVSGGSNIYPREVEEVLLRHPQVSEVSVVGSPDPEWGEIVVAFVVGEVEPTALDALCRAEIAAFKKPKRYVFVEELPKNNYGKVLKIELRERLKARESEAGAD